MPARVATNRRRRSKKIDWQFHTADAGIELRRLYPQITLCQTTSIGLKTRVSEVASGGNAPIGEPLEKEKKMTDEKPPLAKWFAPHAVLVTAVLLLGGLVPATSRGDILYVTYETNKVEKFTSNGVGSLFANTGFQTQPEGLAFDGAGNLYVANVNSSASTIEKFTPAGVGSTFATASTGANRPLGLAFDAAGNLYSGNVGNLTIEKFNIKTGVGSFFASTSPGAPTGIAFDSAGNLYVATQSNNVIEKFTPDGVGSVFATVNTVANSLAGLAIDGAGNLYVSDVNANKIDKFNLKTGVASVFASTGLNQPIGLAFDSAGNLYAANQGDNTIERFTPGGVGSLFASVGPNGPQYLAFTSDAGVPLRVPPAIGAPLPSALAMGAGSLGAMLAIRRFGHRRVLSPG
jgi:sugar lactone lactonase YvrE